MPSNGVPRRRASTAWHLVTATVIATCLVVQLIMTLRGISVLIDENGSPVVGLPTRLLRFFTYFTIESNVLALLAAASLVARPLRDGAAWRVARIASVVGMSVTFVVYLVALAPILSLHGVAWWTDIGFHIAAPVLTVLGWLLFGPWPRFDGRSVLWFILWPVCWIGYVLVLGGASGWYPYPFLDAGSRGYPRALLSCLLVAVLLLGIGGGYTLVDRRLGRSSQAHDLR